MTESSAPDDPADLARAYYRALDTGDYGLLTALLTPDFVHERPDRTLEGRERFVRFMREERPQTDTTHPLEDLFVRAEPGGEGETTVAVQGRLLRTDGSEITAFVDVFEVADGRLRSLRTYTH